MSQKPQDHVGVTFVNSVLGTGTLNGVVNIQFGQFNFSPSDDGKIEADPVVALRLRMDIPCARQLRDLLSSLLAPLEMPPVETTEMVLVPSEEAKALN